MLGTLYACVYYVHGIGVCVHFLDYVLLAMCLIYAWCACVKIGSCDAACPVRFEFQKDNWYCLLLCVMEYLYTLMTKNLFMSPTFTHQLRPPLMCVWGTRSCPDSLCSLRQLRQGNRSHRLIGLAPYKAQIMCPSCGQLCGLLCGLL